MSLVSQHYGGAGGILSTITAAYDSAGIDPRNLHTADLAPLDEFHIRGRAATLEIVDALDVGPESRVLDLGSGIGGPARALAEATGCTVTGIDLTPEFVDVATALSEWTGLSGTRFVVGDATATGVPDASMDAVLTVHVAMNIPDKSALCAEAYRVLRPGGRFVAYDVLQGEAGDVRYPVPWAPDASISFLATREQTRDTLSRAGFLIRDEVDSTEQSLAWFASIRAAHGQRGPAPITFAAFLGDTFPQMATNQVTNLAERRIRTVMYTCLRPA